MSFFPSSFLFFSLEYRSFLIRIDFFFVLRGVRYGLYFSWNTVELLISHSAPGILDLSNQDDYLNQITTPRKSV